MNISELREAFKSASGFLFWTNASIDEAINNGIKFLDSKTFSSKKDQVLFRKLEIGKRFVIIPMECKVIKEVWISNAEERQRLTKVESFPLNYYEETGTPISYYPFSTETFEKTFDKMFVFSNFADLVFCDGLVRGVVFNCYAEEEYSIMLKGRFNILSLSDEFSSNWWSVNYPELVVTTAMYVLDINRRNSSGGAELSGVIMDTIREINNDAIEEEVEDVSLVLEG